MTIENSTLTADDPNKTRVRFELHQIEQHQFFGLLHSSCCVKSANFDHRTDQNDGRGGGHYVHVAVLPRFSTRHAKNVCSAGGD